MLLRAFQAYATFGFSAKFTPNHPEPPMEHTYMPKYMPFYYPLNCFYNNPSAKRGICIYCHDILYGLMWYWPEAASQTSDHNQTCYDG